MTDDVWTVGRLLVWTTDFLKNRGGESPRLDAEVLLAHARQTDRVALYTSYEEEVDEIVRGQYRELVKRRADGWPVAYLVGRREFYSLSFEVTPDVLIPRPETEHLVMLATDWGKQRSDAALQVVEVGTGSGVIAVCLAKYLPQATIYATDISEAALQVAQRNAVTHGVADRIEFAVEDLAAPERLAACQLLVSNPPYIGRVEANQLTREVRDHEPESALFGGQRGDEFSARLLRRAAEDLPAAATVLLEINAGLSSEMLELARSIPQFAAASVHKDLAGRPRVLQLETA